MPLKNLYCIFFKNNFFSLLLLYRKFVAKKYIYFSHKFATTCLIFKNKFREIFFYCCCFVSFRKLKLLQNNSNQNTIHGLMDNLVKNNLKSNCFDKRSSMFFSSFTFCFNNKMCSFFFVSSIKINMKTHTHNALHIEML